MARLPEPGADAGQWGDILNDYLQVAHTGDGALKANSIGAVQLQPQSVSTTALLDSSVTEDKLDDAVKTKLNASSDGAVASVAGKVGAVTLVKGDVGLTNVDNTSDANKPISTAVQTALNTIDQKIDNTFWVGTQAEYNAILVKDPNTIYFVSED